MSDELRPLAFNSSLITSYLLFPPRCRYLAGKRKPSAKEWLKIDGRDGQAPRRPPLVQGRGLLRDLRARLLRLGRRRRRRLPRSDREARLRPVARRGLP